MFKIITMKKVKFGDNKIFYYNGKIKKTRLYPIQRSNKNEKNKTISGNIIRKCKYYYKKKIVFYYYYKKLEYNCKLIVSKIIDDDPIVNKLLRSAIDCYDDAIHYLYYI